MASCVRCRVVQCASAAPPPQTAPALLGDVTFRRAATPKGRQHSKPGDELTSGRRCRSIRAPKALTSAPARLMMHTLQETEGMQHARMQPLPLRWVPLKDLSCGNVYEAGSVQVQFRALLRGCHGPSSDVLAVAVRDSARPSPWQAAQMTADLSGADSSSNEDRRLDPEGPRFPDIGGNSTGPCDLSLDFPFWPPGDCDELGLTGAKGPATVVYHAGTFLEMLHLSSFPAPVLFPHGAFKLDTRLGPVAARLQELLVRRAAGDGRGTRRGGQIARSLLSALGGDGVEKLSGGRLVGMMEDGLCQLGDGLLEGLLHATSAPQTIQFPGPPMGIGLGPTNLSDEVGAMVSDVEPDSYADNLGVEEGWTLDRINGTETGTLPFWDIDSMFDELPPWEIKFGTASRATNLYAVEIPAAELMHALPPGADMGKAAEAAHSPAALADAVEIGPELQETAGSASSPSGSGGPFLWQEPFSRLFIGDAGSMTCLHVDLLPQLEFCHMLVGSKVLGACSWAETPRLLEEHGGVLGPTAASGADNDANGCDDCGPDSERRPETSVPADRPLDESQVRLLADPAVGLVVARAGDVAVFSSAAAHFATNGGVGATAALYHGGISPAAVPRLCADACSSRQPFTESEREGEYSRHLTSSELAADLAQQALADSEAGGEPSAETGQRIPPMPEVLAEILARSCGQDQEAAVARLSECRVAMNASLRAIRSAGTQPEKAWDGETRRWHTSSSNLLKEI